MDKYELVVVLDATLSQVEKEKIIKEVQEIIVKTGAKIVNSQVWLEKHRFFFRMQKCNEGTYYLINFESKRSGIQTLRQNLRIHERLLRFLLVKAE